MSVATELTHFVVPKSIWDAIQTLLQEVREEGERQVNEKQHRDGISIAQLSAGGVSSEKKQDSILDLEESIEYEGEESNETGEGDTDGEAAASTFGANTESSETERRIQVHSGSNTPGAEQYWTENHTEEFIQLSEVCTGGNGESGNDASRFRHDDEYSSGGSSTNVFRGNSLELLLDCHSDSISPDDSSKPYVPLRSRPLSLRSLDFDPAFSPRVIPQDSSFTLPLSPPEPAQNHENSPRYNRRLNSGSLPPPQFEFETYSEDLEPTSPTDSSSSTSLQSPYPLSPPLSPEIVPPSPRSPSRELAMESPRASTSRHLEGSETSASRKTRRNNSGRSSKAAANSRKRDTLGYTTPASNFERGRSSTPSPIRCQHGTPSDVVTPPNSPRQHLVHHAHHRRSNLVPSRHSHHHSSLPSTSNSSNHASNRTASKPLSSLSIPEEREPDSSEEDYDERFVHLPSLRRPLPQVNEGPYRLGGRGSRNLFCGEQYRLFAIDRSKWNRTGHGYMTGPPGMFDLN